MNKLLTIAIPTFNRAELLERQLAWLAQAIKGFESQCEIIISDNCSTDNTVEVIEQWQSGLTDITVKLNQQPENVGAIRNIAYCINEAAGQYVWTISDDDKIGDRALANLLNILSEEPDLAMIILNFSYRDLRTDKLLFERCYNLEREVNISGKALFANCLDIDSGGVTLTTALVYRSDLAQQALQQWSAGLDNLAVQMYVTGFCALHGRVKLTRESYLECAGGTHFWLENIPLRMKLRYAEMPEVYVKLMALGYSQKLCQRMTLKQFKEIKSKLTLKALIKHPFATANALSRYLAALWQVSYPAPNFRAWEKQCDATEVSSA